MFSNNYLISRLDKLNREYMSARERVKLAPYVKANSVKSETDRISDIISRKYGKIPVS